ncbi:hypothetical protein HN873_052013 [Arachis hypogaea]
MEEHEQRRRTKKMSRERVTHMGSMEGYWNQATMEIGGLLGLRMATPGDEGWRQGGYGSARLGFSIGDDSDDE